MPRRVVIESPYGGDVEKSLAYLGEAILDCLSKGEAPIASHGLFTRFLNDHNPAQRKLGMEAGHAWIGVSEAVVVYKDLGISSGMWKGIGEAEKAGVKIEYRNIRSNNGSGDM